MANDRITTIALGDYLDRQIDEALDLLRKRNPGVEFTREKLIQLLVGYGLDHVLRRRERRKVHLPGHYRKMHPPGQEEEMTVESLSLSGAGFITIEEDTVRLNDILRISFHLDEGEAVVHKNAIVKNVAGRHVGVDFIVFLRQACVK